MPIMFFTFLLVFPLWAADIPKINSCYNEDLLGKTSINEYFAARRQNKKCQGAIRSSYLELVSAQTEIKTLLRKKQEESDPKKRALLEGQIDKKDSELEKSRSVWRSHIRDCGPCRIELSGPYEVNNSKYWYNSEGVCQFSVEDLELFNFKEKITAEAFFKTGKDLLLSPATYEKAFNKETLTFDGFFHLLRFAVYDEQTGERVPFKKNQKIEKFPFYTFVSVRGRPAATSTAIGYLIKNYEAEGGQKQDELLFKFLGVPNSAKVNVSSDKFRPTDYSRSGQALSILGYPPFFSLIETKEETKPQVEGSWCIQKKGESVNYSYRTNANLSVLGFLPEFVMKKYGAEVHSDMLLEFYEKVLNEVDAKK